MKILSVVGARPQFVKLAPVDKEIRKADEHLIVHTGQHYDPSMSDSFFSILDIPVPDYNLSIGSKSHGHQTGEMIASIEDVLLKERPDCVFLYGDTNSTLAGSIAAAKMHIKTVHIEAGLRSFNRRMPEELNRVLTDHASDILLCPSKTAFHNLEKENLGDRARIVGDVMMQLLHEVTDFITADVLDELSITKGEYILMTMHRQENVDDPVSLGGVMDFISSIEETVVFPMHPRTRNRIQEFGLWNKVSSIDNLRLIEPQDFLSFSSLEKNAKVIMTDSGGVQKDAYFFGVPCITLREETEWLETVEEGWNILVGTDIEKIHSSFKGVTKPKTSRDSYGGTGVTSRIMELVREKL